MTGNPKVGRWDLAPNPLLEMAGVVFSELSASQPSEEGFHLTGALYFNEGSLEFENGRCSFYLKDATLSARCHAAYFEPQTIAFRQIQRDSRSVSVTTKVDAGRSTAAGAHASATLGFQLPTGMAAGIGAGARAEIQVNEQAVQQATETHVLTQPLAWAIIRNKSDVSWRIQADPASVVMVGSLNSPVLNGARLAAGDAPLGYVKLNAPGGHCELSVGVKHVNIVFTELELEVTWSKPLKDLAGEILRGRDKRAIISRLCLQKSLEGSMRLGSLP